MSKMSQKEAVYGAVVNVKGTTEFSSAVEMSREERAMVNQILFEGFRGGAIELDTEFTDQQLKAYVSGLQSNWLRKDKRLNGGVAYVAKNPGSRSGSGDPQLKALRALLGTLTDVTDRAEVQAHIDARVAEIARSKQPTIDLSALPPELAAKFAPTATSGE
ncbi:hypothetical protein EBU99_14000 [bacterium]|nr:hypothetical protein [bacterium]